jgi:hypothetical protein
MSPLCGRRPVASGAPHRQKRAAAGARCNSAEVCALPACTGSTAVPSARRPSIQSRRARSDDVSASPDAQARQLLRHEPHRAHPDQGPSVVRGEAERQEDAAHARQRTAQRDGNETIAALSLTCQVMCFWPHSWSARSAGPSSRPFGVSAERGLERKGRRDGGPRGQKAARAGRPE